MIIGGLLPFINNLIPRTVISQFFIPRFSDIETLIWSISITLSPLVLLFASQMKAHWVTYIVPIYTYTYQLLTFICFAKGSKLSASSYFIYYAIGISIILFVIFKVLSLYIQTIFLKDDAKDELLNQMFNSHSDDDEKIG
ncbi:hypothetical protein GNY06_03985 [Elizabethkingia argentiflava]|uniref:Uncharacterized protein n=2 Tax=Elizabethkingia argenteiflava TaxID=2681556 RepID=A0A845PW85_9FLAO|nr:hypothetical protein [Elizabethkingia argenteiflava]